MRFSEEVLHPLPGGTLGTLGTYGTFGTFGTCGTYGTYGTFGTYFESKGGRIGLHGRGRALFFPGVHRGACCDLSDFE